jgi:ribose/xylose/arabinose/galactoside ABC-type transport system permease subunit
MSRMLVSHRYFPLLITCALFLALFVAGAVQYAGFGSGRVFFNLFTDNAFLMITAIGMTFVILSGGIDLSVGAIIALTGVVCAVLIEQYHWHPLQIFPLILAGAVCFGAAMGALIHYYQLQPFIVTLAGMFCARGLATTISESSTPINHPFYNAVSAFGFDVPGSGWVGAILAAHYTRFGNNVYAIGGNRRDAELMGVPVAATTIGIYALSSGFAALAGIVFSFYTFSGYSLAAMGVELDAIAAVVIGGTLLTGGSGYVFGTMIGVLIMGLIQTYISFHGALNSWWTKIVIGMLLLFFIALQKSLGSFRKS